MMLIAQGKVKRVDSLVRVALKNGAGIQGICQKLSEAAGKLTSTKSFTEDDMKLAYLVWKMGGPRLVNIVARALGGPSVSTVRRHMGSKGLQASVAFPTSDEMRHNLKISLGKDSGEVGALTEAPTVTVGYVLAVDEIAVEKRMRWDPERNMIIGLCREHGHKRSLEFNTMDEADEILKCLVSGEMHLSSEASVLAVSGLGDSPKEGVARPIVLSGTCKRETVPNQTRLLRLTADTLKEELKSVNGRLYVIATDGDARRRRALIPLTLSHDLQEGSPLYSMLGPLPLFNRRMGVDECTVDFDQKHLFKRARSALLSAKGITINGVKLTKDVIKAHLKSEGMPETTARILLAPEDKQDVPVALRLLSAIARLPDAKPESPPLFRLARKCLRYLGHLYRHLLEAHTNLKLTLREQLAHLSAAAHLLLAGYTAFKGDLCPSQFYFDQQSTIKTAYFCVAKVKRDNPKGQLHLMRIGTDALEKLFGIYRTMIGNDTNVDTYQLASRATGAVNCTRILEEKPDWDPGTRRLQMKSSIVESTEDDSVAAEKSDHINPKAWEGDVHVEHANLQTHWIQGRATAEEEL
ncbi:hypothetical protein SISNIDRAFT_402445, partial [Sistotremastrum niveocremeum HHB9708]